MRNHNTVHDQANAIYDRYMKAGLQDFYGTTEQLRADIVTAEKQRAAMGDVYFARKCWLIEKACEIAKTANSVVFSWGDAQAVDSLADAMTAYRDAFRDLLEASENIALADIEIARGKEALEGR